jgi:hypothetical protein
MFSILFLVCFLLIALFRGSFAGMNLEVDILVESIQVNFLTFIAMESLLL